MARCEQDHRLIVNMWLRMNTSSKIMKNIELGDDIWRIWKLAIQIVDHLDTVIDEGLVRLPLTSNEMERLMHSENIAGFRRAFGMSRAKCFTVRLNVVHTVIDLLLGVSPRSILQFLFLPETLQHLLSYLALWKQLDFIFTAADQWLYARQTKQQL